MQNRYAETNLDPALPKCSENMHYILLLTHRACVDWKSASAARGWLCSSFMHAMLLVSS